MIPTGLKNIIGSVGPLCDPRPTRGGKGLSFDGVDGGSLVFDDIKPFGSQNSNLFSVSWCFWIKPTIADNRFLGLNTVGGNSSKMPYVRLFNNKVQIYNSSGYVGGNINVNLNELNFICITYNHITDKQRIYVNGVFDVELDGNSSNSPYIIRNYFSLINNNGRTFKGDVYSVQLSKEILDDAGVDDLYSNYRVLDMTGGGLLLNLEEENGLVVFDSSGVDNNGALTGGVVRINPLSQHTFKSDDWLIPNFDIDDGNVVSYPPDTFRVSAYYKYMQTSETYDLTNNGCLIFKTTIPDLAQRFYINFNSKSSWTSNVNGLRIAVDGALNVYLNSSSVASFSFDILDDIYFVISNQGCYLVNISNGFISNNLGVPNDLNQPISLGVGIDSNKDLNAEFWQTNLSIDDVLKTFKPIYSRADEVGYSGYFDIFNLTDYNYWSYTTNVYNLSLDSPNFVDTDICTILSNKAFEFKAGSYGNGASSLSYVFPRITNNQDLRHTLFPDSLVKYKLKATCTQLEGDLGSARIYFVKSNGQVNMVESFVNGVATFDYEGDMYLKDAASNAYLQFRKNNATNYRVRWEVQEFTMEIISPRDESNTDFDVLGNELQFTGKACGANE